MDAVLAFSLYASIVFPEVGLSGHIISSQFQIYEFAASAAEAHWGRIRAVHIRIDGMHHALLAVVAVGLAAVDPDGLLVLDRDGEGRRAGVVGRGVGCEAREEALVERMARVLKG